MKLFYKRNIVVGIIALTLGVFGVFAMAKTFGHTQTTAAGTVAAFILNPEGQVDGAVLDTGDQVHFGAETGAIVAGQIKIGDQLTVTGRAGSKSVYGREVRAETVQIGGQTINVIHARPKPPRGGGKGKDDKPKNLKGERNPLRPEGEETPPIENVDANVSPKPAARETITATGAVKIVLVGGRGEARGLILNDGTQVALPKEVSEKDLTFNEQTSVSVEGEAAKSAFGTFIRPTRLTVGDQTFSFNR